VGPNDAVDEDPAFLLKGAHRRGGGVAVIAWFVVDVATKSPQAGLDVFGLFGAVAFAD
jgi:hypothetical protein